MNKNRWLLTILYLSLCLVLSTLQSTNAYYANPLAYETTQSYAQATPNTIYNQALADSPLHLYGTPYLPGSEKGI